MDWSGFGSWAKDKAWFSACIDSSSDKASADVKAALPEICLSELIYL
jgi:hypothetical protein